MKKKLSKILAATLLIGSMVGITPALAISIAPTSGSALIEAGDGIITPFADQFATYYRVYNGVNQYRIWNITQGYWTMPWTDC